MIFDDNKEVLVSVEQFAREARLPAALVRLAIDCGCPTDEKGRISILKFSPWFSDNYNKVRAAAGLPVLDEGEGKSSLVRARIAVRNTLQTYTDYYASRSSDLAIKRACQKQSDRFANEAE